MIVLLFLLGLIDGDALLDLKLRKIALFSLNIVRVICWQGIFWLVWNILMLRLLFRNIVCVGSLQFKGKIIVMFSTGERYFWMVSVWRSLIRRNLVWWSVLRSVLSSVFGTGIVLRSDICYFGGISGIGWSLVLIFGCFLYLNWRNSYGKDGWLCLWNAIGRILIILPSLWWVLAYFWYRLVCLRAFVAVWCFLWFNFWTKRNFDLCLFFLFG